MTVVPLRLATPLEGGVTMLAEPTTPVMYGAKGMVDDVLARTFTASETALGALGAEMVTLTAAVPAEAPPALVAE